MTAEVTSTYRRTFIIALASLSLVTQAKAWILIPEEEIERDKLLTRSGKTGAPTIDVDQPAGVTTQTSPPVTINSPVTISISFHPQQGATIDKSSFRATYSSFFGFQIDITQRIVDNAQLTETGLFAKDAEIPAGSYEVTLQIADNLHRVGSRTINFTVA